MPSSINLTSFTPAAPVAPVPPDFRLCQSAYGNGLRISEAIYTAGLLPIGAQPVTYSVTQDEEGGSAQSYTLPFDVSFGGVVVTVELSAPVGTDSITLVPNGIRGMAAYLANSCARRWGTGGFVTTRTQGLIDYVTNPFSNLDAPEYPDSAAFVTVTMSSQAGANSFPGDYDPAMAVFLRQNLADVLSRTQPSLRGEIEDRIVRYTVQGARMHRLGQIAWWDEEQLGGNTTQASNHISNGDHANVTALQLAISRQVRKSR